MSSEQTISVLKALADPTRLKIIRQLADCKHGQETCSKLSSRENLSQPALSHHFGKLVAAGIVSENKVGTSKDYTLNKEFLLKHGIDVTKL